MNLPSRLTKCSLRRKIRYAQYRYCQQPGRRNARSAGNSSIAPIPLLPHTTIITASRRSVISHFLARNRSTPPMGTDNTAHYPATSAQPPSDVCPPHLLAGCRCEQAQWWRRRTVQFNISAGATRNYHVYGYTAAASPSGRHARKYADTPWLRHIANAERPFESSFP